MQEQTCFLDLHTRVSDHFRVIGSFLTLRDSLRWRITSRSFESRCGSMQWLIHVLASSAKGLIMAHLQQFCHRWEIELKDVLKSLEDHQVVIAGPTLLAVILERSVLSDKLECWKKMDSGFGMDPFALKYQGRWGAAFHGEYFGKHIQETFESRPFRTTIVNLAPTWENVQDKRFAAYLPYDNPHPSFASVIAFLDASFEFDFFKVYLEWSAHAEEFTVIMTHPHAIVRGTSPFCSTSELKQTVKLMDQYKTQGFHIQWPRLRNSCLKRVSSFAKDFYQIVFVKSFNEGVDLFTTTKRLQQVDHTELVRRFQNGETIQTVDSSDTPAVALEFGGTCLCAKLHIAHFHMTRFNQAMGSLGAPTLFVFDCKLTLSQRELIDKLSTTCE